MQRQTSYVAPKTLSCLVMYPEGFRRAALTLSVPTAGVDTALRKVIRMHGILVEQRSVDEYNTTKCCCRRGGVTVAAPTTRPDVTQALRTNPFTSMRQLASILHDTLGLPLLSADRVTAGKVDRVQPQEGLPGGGAPARPRCGGRLLLPPT